MHEIVWWPLAGRFMKAQSATGLIIDRKSANVDYGESATTETQIHRVYSL